MIHRSGYLKRLTVVLSIALTIVIAVILSLLLSKSTVKQVTVDFIVEDEMGMTTKKSRTGEIGEILEIPSFEKEGYFLFSWYYDQELTMKHQISSFPKEKLVLYGKQYYKYKITYQADVASLVSNNPDNYIFKDNIQLFPGYVKGMVFDKWTLDGEVVTEIDVSQKRDLQFKAHFIDGSGNIDDTTIIIKTTNADGVLEETTLTGQPGETISLVNPIAPSGYQFSGWYLDELYTMKYHETIYPTDDIIIYSKMLKEFTVNYQTSSIGTPNFNNLTVFTTLDIYELKDPKLIDHVFEKWTLSDDFTIITKIENITSNLILHAHFIKVVPEITTINVTFINDDGSILTTLTVPDGKTINEIGGVPTPTKLGYDLDGWFKESTIFDLDTTINKSEADFILKAKYLAKDVYLQFTYNGSQIGSDVIVKFNDKITTFPTLPPIDTGYEFDYWQHSQLGVVTLSTVINLEGDSSGPLIIELITKYVYVKVMFIVENITTNPSDVLGKPGTSFVLPTPSKASHCFDGWYLDNSYTSKYEGGNVLSSNLTLYGKMTEIVSISYTARSNTDLNLTTSLSHSNHLLYDLDKGTVLSDANIINGYVFLHWASASDLLVPIITISSNTKITDLVACFTLITYKIHYSFQTGVLDSLTPINYSVESGLTGTEVLDLVNTGYTFNYWTHNGQQFTGLPANFIGEITLDAVYTSSPVDFQITYTAVVVENGVSTSILAGDWSFETNPESYNIDIIYQFVPGVSSHMTFISWFDLDKQEVVYGIEKKMGNLNLQALFEHKLYSVTLHGNGAKFGVTDTKQVKMKINSPISEDTISLQNSMNSIHDSNMRDTPYTFNGWYINGIRVTVFALDILDEIIYADWHGNFKYEVSGSHVIVLGWDGYDDINQPEHLYIPNMRHLGFVINEIKNNAFEIYLDITSRDAGKTINSFNIPKTVSLIGENSFAFIPYQGQVTIPEGVQTISVGAFMNATITALDLSNVQFINTNAFIKTSIKNIDTKNVVEIQPSAFQAVLAESIHIGKALLFISVGAFADIKHPTVSSIPIILTFEQDSRLNSIDYQGFVRTKIDRIELPNTLRKVGSDAFGESGVKELIIDIEKSILTEIGNKAFAGHNLTSKTIFLGNYIELVGTQAFSSTISILEILEFHNIYIGRIPVLGSKIASEVEINKLKIKAPQRLYDNFRANYLGNTTSYNYTFELKP